MVYNVEAAGAGTAVEWVVNGGAVPPTAIPVRPGDTITVAVKQGEHDLVFPDGARARTVFRFEMPGSPLSARGGAGRALGTNRLSGGTVLATLTVRSDIPANINQVAITSSTPGGQTATATFVIVR
jgi:hypothetical protein